MSQGTERPFIASSRNLVMGTLFRAARLKIGSGGQAERLPEISPEPPTRPIERQKNNLQPVDESNI